MTLACTTKTEPIVLSLNASSGSELQLVDPSGSGVYADGKANTAGSSLNYNSKVCKVGKPLA